VTTSPLSGQPYPDYKKIGTLTLFAFDAGQGLSEHTAPFVPWLKCWTERAITIDGTRIGAADMMNTCRQPAALAQGRVPYKSCW